MSRIFTILFIFGAVTSLSFSIPRSEDLNTIEDSLLMGDLEDKKIGIPTGELLNALTQQSQQDLDFSGTGRGAGFFNLTAYLTTNRQNGTALTFVPLITLLLGIIQGIKPAGGNIG